MRRKFATATGSGGWPLETLRAKARVGKQGASSVADLELAVFFALKN